MSNPILDIIEQVPKGERLGIVNEVRSCTTVEEALAVAEKHDIHITEEQFEAAKAFIMSNPSEEELTEIVAACVPKILVPPTMAALKAKLG